MGERPRKVLVIGTADTKGKELAFVADSIRSTLSRLVPDETSEVQVLVVDVSLKLSDKWSPAVNVSIEDVLSHHPAPSRKSLSSLPSDRASSASIVSNALEHYLQSIWAQGDLVGAIGLGGSGGTSIIAPALRTLPVGLPKILVSTVASGNTRPYIESSDLILLPSVVDIAGLNSVSKAIFSNAAAALSGMIASKLLRGHSVFDDGIEKATVGLTMFGVTTPCVDAVRQRLEAEGYETLVFHATGVGGRAMESLVAQGFIKGVLDITTTEVADYVVGGVMACDGNRFDAISKQKVPLVLSVGAMDMVNFGAKDTVPEQFLHRNLFVHNAQVTLMRTDVNENIAAAKFIAKKLNLFISPVRVLLPEKGISALDDDGKPFLDVVARGALMEELEKAVDQNIDRQVKRFPYHINDIRFADALVDAFVEIMPSNVETIIQSRKGEQTPHEVHNDTSDFNKFGFMLKTAKQETLILRENILETLKKVISSGSPVIGAGAGTGISAKCEEEGGADLLVVYNSGRFRMAGRGSLSGLMPFKDANAVVLEMANEILPVVKRIPVLAGVCATDPFRSMDKFLRQLEEIGYAGVQNFPTVGLIDGNFRQNLEETGMGYGLEVDMIKQAHEMGFLTTPYAFNKEESLSMAKAGADIIVAHMGLTTSGSIGAKTSRTIEDCVTLIQEIADAAHKVNPDVIVLCHGGPISGPKEAEFILNNTIRVHGFYGASSMERLPVEVAISTTMREYKCLKLQPA